jgi:hypothetical protein
MPTEKEIMIIQKATIYDLQRILEKEPEKSYTVEELKALLNAYITGAEQ